MRFNGHNILAILLAAIAIYAMGFLVYGLMIKPEEYMTMARVNELELAASQWKMPLGIIMPILIAIGLSFVIKWRNAAGWMGGVSTGFIVALFFLFAERMYGYVYSFEGERLLAIDGAYTFASAMVGGAIIAAWK